MEPVLTIANEDARHPLRRSVPLIIEPELTHRDARHEDIAFFLISFTSAFIILYGFII